MEKFVIDAVKNHLKFYLWLATAFIKKERKRDAIEVTYDG